MTCPLSGDERFALAPRYRKRYLRVLKQPQNLGLLGVNLLSVF